MPLPDFLIIGAQKAGTTWLRAMLRRHPDVYMPDRELHFFNKDRTYQRGLDWYSRQFRGAKNGHLIGEKTPNYLWTNVPASGSDASDTHRRIAESLPDVKLLAILRNPVDRAVSAYNHHLCRGRFPPHVPMNQVLFGEYQHLCRRHGVLSMGAYAEPLHDYLELFRRDQLKILIFEEDVVNDPDQGIQKTCDFLNLNPDRLEAASDEARHVHSFSKARTYLNYWLPVPIALTRPVDFFSSPWKRTPDPETRIRLQEYYAPHQEALYDLLGRRIDAWS
ncbi:MAG TPA: sulfotransferase domain-containing protein [Salinibacter sp.]|nr:sulfotransferase domain-containing protein [Salinibacter sp.]